ncbi:MAG: ketopantoate reductase family protein, partial [Bacillota bacterium]|nr:ketopantoate reductase family protein [Bacillota bacterium]MDW7685386.1 ketopantoate reductase family protein [Bacillota bacterium]
MKIKKVSLVGLGAIGGAYASRIMDSAPETLQVIVDQDRIKRYRPGILVNGKRYEFPYVSPDASAEPADLILVTVKFHHLDNAVRAIKNHVGPDTVILSLLNGISSEEIIGEEYGLAKVLYGMCVGIDAVRYGTAVSYSAEGKIYFGEKDNSRTTQRVAAVAEFFDQCSIPYVIPEDMMRTLWWKFMVNVGINQVSGVLRAPYGVFQNIPQAERLMRRAMLEVVQIAGAAGIPLHENEIDDFIVFLNSLSPEGKTSMLQDVEAGRKTEVEMFAGEVCRQGKTFGIP